MTRALLIAPTALLISAALGWAVCRSAGVDPHARELALAGAIAMVASIVAALPIVLTRGASQPAAAQAGLVSTAAHLMVATALAAAVLMAIKPAPAFVYWMLAFYWVTLIGVAIASVRAVKSAAPASAGPKQ